MLFIWMLSRIPPPDAADIAARSARVPMSRSERWALAGRYAMGIGLIVAIYLAVTILRSLRADFAREIWQGLGSPAAPETFTFTELWVAFGVLLVNGLAVLIRDNRRAFSASLATCAAGALLLVAALTFHRAGRHERDLIC